MANFGSKQWSNSGIRDRGIDGKKNITLPSLEEQNVGDDLCDRCMRSGIVVDHTDKDGNTVCLECAAEEKND